MTLENLLAIHRLQSFTPSREGVQRLLAAAQRNLIEARLAALSAESDWVSRYSSAKGAYSLFLASTLSSVRSPHVLAVGNEGAQLFSATLRPMKLPR